MNVSKQAQPDVAALFISDLHLQADMPRTTQAFFDFLHRHAAHASRLYLLGDIFEAWAGDDDIDDPYHRQVVEEIRKISDGGTTIFWMAGNRDFLVGEQFAQTAGLTLLPDPFVVSIANHRIALTHGDAWCTDDEAYMQFRAQVRQQEWQRNFLALPLAQRKEIVEKLRAGSRDAQKGKSYEITDVNEAAITSLFDRTEVTTMIHGHTHRPAKHTHSKDVQTSRVRYVLSDWDLDHGTPRGDWLAIDIQGTIKRFRMDGEEIED
ncbi:MAG TPA: UDP-2,3-diacylglucosamine diphosphatase [Oxalicibacterium sp.]|uniref:UDP-2,3-diacylglucosamine diphosphatase n=1 Tax=Oxalicibacterium sp. TaxID=2766525 RepID=UPI002CA61D5F|nr:UDP-2,3-diacylglucosamine diphosphatase [Oxalicibacterium sp.]HWU98446.1 UDP-2,3-diacylglucosamine diphosphatase [Oxalicibacterium sp.]